MPATTATFPCTCAHAGQDRIYGPGNRLMNACRRTGGKIVEPWFRCTVCGSEHVVRQVEAA